MWEFWNCKLLLLQNSVGYVLFFVYLLLHTQVFKGHCQDTGRELAVKIVRDLNEKVDE